MVKEKDKIHFYNSLVDCYYKTGQGFPGKIMRVHGGEGPVIDELIKDGLVKSVMIKYSTCDDDEWICLTKGYCVEESYGDYLNKDMDNLTFIKIYRNSKNDVAHLTGGKTVVQLFENKEFKKKYNLWLGKNMKKLNEKIEHLKEKKPKKINLFEKVLSDEEVKYIETSNWYKGNWSVKECKIHVDELLELETKRLSITDEILEIMEKTPMVYKTEIGKNRREKKKSEEDIAILKSISEWLNKFKHSLKIKTLIK